MTRDDAFTLLTKYMQNNNLLKHSLAAEASMRGIFRYLHPSGEVKKEEIWGITGLLHDIDYQVAMDTNQLEKHGSLLFDEHPDLLPEDITRAVRAHNYEGTGVMPQSDMEWAIAIVDGLTGFIVSCTLVHPDKKLASISPDFIIKRLKQPAFSRNVRREVIYLCDEKLGMSLETFVKTTLTAMQSIHEDLGL